MGRSVEKEEGRRKEEREGREREEREKDITLPQA